MIKDGYIDKVYYRYFVCDDKNIANVFAIHGLGGHCKWFDKAGELFNKKSINLFSFDLPGFGQSKYPKGTIDSYNTWIESSRVTLENFLNNFNITSPVFILGHSMGALISILLSKSVRAHGWILSVPGFEGNKKTWSFSKFVLPVMLKAFLKSNEEITVPFGPELLTKNKQTQIEIKKDPLRVTKIDVQTYKHVYFLTKKAKHSLSNLNSSVLFLISGNDLVCSNETMESFYNEISVRDKSKKIYTNSFHDLFIEDELPQIVDDISAWVKQRI